MGNHPFNVIVVLFWLATMTWLMVAKILPPLRVGEPPSYHSILKDKTPKPLVFWCIRLEDKPIGWAASKIEQRSDGITELYSRVYLRDLPLDAFAPAWLATVLKPVLRDLGPLDVHKTSWMTVDPLGRLVGFESRVQIADVPDAIRVHGQIEGSALKLSVQSGELPQKLERYLPPDALLTDELSPQSTLPGLRVGQRWTVPLYSPFRPPTSPIEILQAHVERAERITWDGQTVGSRIIVYRSDPGSGLVTGEPRGRMWVRDDGVVVQQEVTILRSHLRFVRLSDERTDVLARALSDDWKEPISDEVAKKLLRGADAFSP